jgi:hypothetical protein
MRKLQIIHTYYRYKRKIKFSAISEFAANVYVTYIYRARGSVAVKALCYKPEGRGFDTR